jgi:glycosyltransferase involved in cell wall biosynthesis
MNIEFVINRSGIYGGVKRIYIVAEYLRQAGHTVVVNSEDGKQNNWFSHTIPENIPIGADIRVCAETCRKLLPDAVNILYQQAQFDAPEEDEKFDLVVSTTKYLTDFLQRTSGITPDYQIPYGIDSSIFKPAPGSKSDEKITNAYMPRKNKEEFDLIMKIMPPLYRNGHHAAIEWLPIDGMSENNVIAALQKTDIFLALSKDEGFGLPPFESSLCGCLIVGYHGRGGKEWLTKDTCALTSCPQEFPIRLQEALDGKFEAHRVALQRLIKEHLTVEKERTAWLNVINHAINLHSRRRLPRNT